MVVTRHRGVLDWLRFVGAPVDTWEVISHVNRPEEIQGKLVIGALPLHLAAAAHGIGSIDLPLLLPEQRGKDLSVQEMRDAGAYLRFYRVTQKEMPSWVKNWA